MGCLFILFWIWQLVSGDYDVFIKLLLGIHFLLWDWIIGWFATWEIGWENEILEFVIFSIEMDSDVVRWVFLVNFYCYIW